MAHHRATYTVLVTVDYQTDDAAPTNETLANAIQCALEEGCTDHQAYLAAQVDVWSGICVRPGGIGRRHLSTVLPLHDLR